MAYTPLNYYKDATSYLDTADSLNGWGLTAGVIGSLGSGIAQGIGLFAQYKVAKYQARLAEAQARIEANQYAAEGVAAEINADRLKTAFAAEEYERIRQQEAYMEDMALDAAIRGGAMEGTNTQMISAQAKEFERGNAYARLQNQREQANYMFAAEQSYENARNAVAMGKANAKAIRSTARTNLMTGLMSVSTGTIANLGQSYLGYKREQNNIKLQRANLGLQFGNYIQDSVGSNANDYGGKASSVISMDYGKLA